MTGLLGWVQGLNGLVLALTLGGLLFIEEVRVPLPFAPGDLLLAIGGIAIAAGAFCPATPAQLTRIYAFVSGNRPAARRFIGDINFDRLGRRVDVEAAYLNPLLLESL